MMDFSRFDLIENRLDRIEAIVDSNARSIAANSDQLAQTERVLAEAIGRTLAVVESTVINLQEYRERNDAQMNSLNAAVERLDAILDRLISNQN